VVVDYEDDLDMMTNPFQNEGSNRWPYERTYLVFEKVHG